ncbi:hypothetical protein BGZ70_005662, partial [Mortierella alpina]
MSSHNHAVWRRRLPNDPGNTGPGCNAEDELPGTMPLTEVDSNNSDCFHSLSEECPAEEQNEGLNELTWYVDHHGHGHLVHIVDCPREQNPEYLFLTQVDCMELYMSIVFASHIITAAGNMSTEATMISEPNVAVCSGDQVASQDHKINQSNGLSPSTQVRFDNARENNANGVDLDTSSMSD